MAPVQQYYYSIIPLLDELHIALMVATSLQAQQRDVLDFLTQAIHAARFGQEHPNLRPQTPAEEETPFGGVAP